MIESGILHVIIPVLIVICAVFVARFEDLIYAALALASLSLLLALEFYLLQAPDVAIAEAAIGAAITTTIIVLAVRSTRRI